MKVITFVFMVVVHFLSFFWLYLVLSVASRTFCVLCIRDTHFSPGEMMNGCQEVNYALCFSSPFPIYSPFLSNLLFDKLELNKTHHRTYKSIYESYQEDLDFVITF